MHLQTSSRREARACQGSCRQAATHLPWEGVWLQRPALGYVSTASYRQMNRTLREPPSRHDALTSVPDRWLARGTDGPYRSSNSPRKGHKAGLPSRHMEEGNTHVFSRPEVCPSCSLRALTLQGTRRGVLEHTRATRTSLHACV